MSDSISTAIDVAYETEVSIESKSTEQLTAEANTLYHQAERLAGMSALMLAETGRRLIEVKNRIPHGEFGKWCEDNLEFSYRKAARTMQLAEKMDDENSLFSKMPTLANIGISRVWALLAAPEEVAAEVVENNDIESMKVRELQDELARVKAEKETAEHKAEMIENNNDDIRKELARAQRELAEAVTEEDYSRMQNEYVEAQKDLENELREAKDASAEIQAKLDKAKEDLKKQKAKLKELEDSKDEDIQKRLAEAGAELEEKARADAQKEVERALKEKTDSIQALEAQVLSLEAEKEKLSNTSLMEFKVYVDQLQDIYFKLNDMITEESNNDEEAAAKMRSALQTVIGRWTP